MYEIKKKAKKKRTNEVTELVGGHRSVSKQQLLKVMKNDEVDKKQSYINEII